MPHPTHSATGRPERSDRGFTLPEILVAVVVSGILLGAIATAVSVMLRATPQAEDRLVESKDITFLQTWVPVDLASAINSYDDPDDAVVKTELANNPPNVSYNSNLPGTNVLTLVVPSAGGGTDIVTYRYLQVNGEWRLARFIVVNPGAGNEYYSQVGVAHSVAEPEPWWTPDQSPTFAFDVTSRNQVVLRPIGEDVEVTFQSGNIFTTGGAGLSAEQNLTPNDPVTLPDPSAPPTRCGGRIALVLDTSYSVPKQLGGVDLQTAATGFLDAFTGTPTEVTVLGFDGLAYQMYPFGAIGQYFSLLNGGQPVADAKAEINVLDFRDVAGQSNSYYYADPNGDGKGWTQPRTTEDGITFSSGGTNWEDALYQPFFDLAGNVRAQTPETVVFITDGQPNSNRAKVWSGGSWPSPADAADDAAAVADDGRATGARIIGVLVGSGTSGAIGYLETVVGSNAWTGTGPDDLGNAVAADYFTGSFDDLGDVLRSIMAAQCGGTVTVQKKLDDGAGGLSDPGGQWTYSTETGSQVLDQATAQSVTFDFTFEAGVTEREVTIREEVVDGYTFDRGDCTIGGQPIPPARITQQPDGTPGVAVLLQPDEAVSCLMISMVEGP